MLNTIIWNNENIEIDNKPVWNANWYNKGIVYVKDLMDTRYKRFLNVNELNSKYNLSENFLSLASMISAIPVQWRNEIKTMDDATFSSVINSNTHDIRFRTSKQTYKLYICKLVKTPTSIHTWQNQYNVTFTEDEWNTIFALPWKITKNYKVIELQYKICHKIFPSNTKVSRFDSTVSKTCTLCPEDDNILHTFYNCTSVKLFWEEVCRLLRAELNIHVLLNLETVIFGFIQEDENSSIVNFLLLYGKYFLYITKKSNNNLNSHVNFAHFFNYMKYVVAAEKHCHLLKEKFVKLEEIINVLNHNHQH